MLPRLLANEALIAFRTAAAQCPSSTDFYNEMKLGFRNFTADQQAFQGARLSTSISLFRNLKQIHDEDKAT
jgi:hypothetical protein